MERAQRFGVFQGYFRHELAGGEVAAPFQFEEEALGADHWAGIKPFQEGGVAAMCRSFR